MDFMSETSSYKDQQAGILTLPPEVLELIISYLPYETVSNIRLVCRAFERACRHRLNQGFSRAERYVQSALKMFRAQLPRRESERREHPLSRRVEHLAAVETRLGLLSMTYRRYMDTDACCFIPGKVLDEVFQVVRYLKDARTVERSSFTVLQELRDISSMAMEHFEEHIVPGLKRCETRPRPLSLLSLFSGGASGGSDGDAGVGDAGWPGASLGNLLNSQRAASEARNKSINVVEHSVAKLNQQVSAQRSRSTAQAQILAELRQQMNEQAEKLAAQDLVITDLTTKLGRVEERLRAYTGEPAEDETAEGGSADSAGPADTKLRKRPARGAAAESAASASKRTKKA
ncbi:F-box only protein 28-like [Amphibalanus amphitrite]|uniref:F-box only protein 28-like n=1 Tax=Amphibalanus amphitrite TaxID=1232801 RepID=UPI001C916CE9|nr:F-box only protein 28-like [Amphibalanus amphitrite]XP_043228817.1 F-box only protein 28-like [Amphibalanus amphitrite]XP_043228818.1 F-box only protein 28-like [Amphibalanus amphitrite]XP_043228819.1 F-box only protein 28-like [Amphibalanus amphitrite]